MIKSSNQLNKIVVIAHNLRSCHNVGSLFRTCEGLAISHLYLSGYTPYPRLNNDQRLPHLSQKIDKQIAKTALNAQQLLPWSHESDTKQLVTALKADGYRVIGLEQSKTSIPLTSYKQRQNIALIVGNEVEGLEQEIMELCDCLIEIPMLGSKESFNVVQAAAMALFYLRFC